MTCAHDGFHTFRSEYDRERGVLIYFRTCERCNERLGVALSEPYRPQYDPRGNDPFVTATLRNAQPA